MVRPFCFVRHINVYFDVSVMSGGHRKIFVDIWAALNTNGNWKWILVTNLMMIKKNWFPFLLQPKLFGRHRRGRVIFFGHAPFLFAIGECGCVGWWLKKFKPPPYRMLTEIFSHLRGHWGGGRAGDDFFKLKNDLTCTPPFWQWKNFSCHLTYPHCRMVTKFFWSP